jgi:hypothetical protein
MTVQERAREWANRYTHGGPRENGGTGAVSTITDVLAWANETPALLLELADRVDELERTRA